MSARIFKSFNARHLDVARFALETEGLSGTILLRDLPRLAKEAVTQAIAPDTPVIINWQAQGEMRRDAGLDDGVARPALYLRARTRLPLVCQRCLQPVWMEVAVDRHFLFAPDEAQAARLDERAQDDVLILAGDFDLFDLIEDELLLALPLAPYHDPCPQPLSLPVQDTGSDAATARAHHPFAALATLKGQKRDTGNL